MCPSIPVTENVGYRLLTVAEDAVDLSPAEKMGDIAERFERQTVADLVFDQSLIFTEFGKCMAMYPLPVWAAKLLVDKLERRVPHRNLGPPIDGNAAHSHFIVDQRTLFQVDRLRCNYLKIKLLRCDAFEVAGVGKKRENRLVWQIERQRCSQDMFGHFCYDLFDFRYFFGNGFSGDSACQ